MLQQYSNLQVLLLFSGKELLFVAVSDPARHLHAAQLMGADISRVKDEDSGRLTLFA